MALIADRPTGSMPPFIRAQFARYQALRAADAGRADEAEAKLTRVIEQLEAMGYPYWTACAQLDLAELLQAQGRVSEASDLEAPARKVLTDLGAGHVLAGAARVNPDAAMA